MADQDAQDINQMMSATSDVAIAKPEKSMFIWVVLGCVVMGVGLGIVVYQQSVKTAIKPSPTPKVAVLPSTNPSIVPSAIPSPVVPQTNLVTQVANTITFPETGKIRIFSDLSNLQLVVTVTISGVKKTLTIPSKALVEPNMNYVDSTFEVKAGDVGTIDAYLNSTSGAKMGGWIVPGTGEICGANTGGKVNETARLAFAQQSLGVGKTIYARQCWADDIDPKDPASYDFNDFYMVWGYVPGTTSASPSPSTSSSVSPSPSASARASASPSLSPSPSASAKASATISPSPSSSPRTVMPDTSEGTPVTGVFEVTMGTISVGLLLLILGIFGLLVI